ncbi:unnamed protein product [Larinioides sclopetarius]|uniref:Ig-like domain-containing protein n=1 Tax=Larinioides sclopetarius TaxID=280406 RepID=A0AAV2AX38_9ARAC
MVRSANGTVYMQDTDVTTTGTYKCEVSADAPSFQTVSAQQRLIVREQDSPHHILAYLGLTKQDLADDALTVVDFLRMYNVMDLV